MIRSVVCIDCVASLLCFNNALRPPFKCGRCFCGEGATLNRFGNPDVVNPDGTPVGGPGDTRVDLEYAEYVLVMVSLECPRMVVLQDFICRGCTLIERYEKSFLSRPIPYHYVVRQLGKLDYTDESD